MDSRELYQDIILDHGRKPRNFHAMAHPSHFAQGHNPLCGDRVTVYLEIDGDKIKDVSFEGRGCAISTASASLLTEAVRGKTTAEVHDLFALFHGAVTAPSDAQPDVSGLGKLAALAGVREFPMRVKCASLAWHTLEAALAGASEPVSTE